MAEACSLSAEQIARLREENRLDRRPGSALGSVAPGARAATASKPTTAAEPGATARSARSVERGSQRTQTFAVRQPERAFCARP